MTGRIASAPSIETVPRGSGKAMFFSVRFGENDIRTALFMAGPGVDRAPCMDDIAVCECRGSDLFITSVQSGEPKSKAGELHVYIRDGNGKTVSEIHCADDGGLKLKLANGKSEISLGADGNGKIKIGGNTVECGNTGIVLNGSLEVLQ